MTEIVNKLGAFRDPQFYADVMNNARMFGRPLNVPTTRNLPSEDQLAIMPWEALYSLRSRKDLSTEDQNYLAPFEHRAYNREFTEGGAEGVQNALLTVGYTPYKMVTSGRTRSQPSFREVGQGLLGVVEGLSNRLRK